jgi:glycosyltransferase involved in cell wall biosynthesis
MKKKSVLCAIPCFNEAYNLPTLFADLESEGIFHLADVLFIDDHSTDETSSMIAKRGFNVIRHQQNLGYGQAVQTGFSVALQNGYEAFIIFPGDHQRSAKDVRKLILTHQENDFDVVSGSKFHIYSQLHGPIRRRIGNIIYSKIAQYGWNSPIEDVLSGFKIYSIKKVAPFFQHLPRGYAFDICFSLYASRYGLRLMEIPVNCRYDAHTSKMKSVLWVSIKMLTHLIIHFFKQPLVYPAPAHIITVQSHRALNVASKTVDLEISHPSILSSQKSRNHVEPVEPRTQDQTFSNLSF